MPGKVSDWVELHLRSTLARYKPYLLFLQLDLGNPLVLCVPWFLGTHPNQEVRILLEDPEREQFNNETDVFKHAENMVTLAHKPKIGLDVAMSCHKHHSLNYCSVLLQGVAKSFARVYIDSISNTFYCKC